MLKTLEEIKKAELPASGVINGVDNANLLSVDSIEPITTETDVAGAEVQGAAVKTETETPAIEKSGEAQETKEVEVTSEVASEVKVETPAKEAKKEAKKEPEIKSEAEAEVEANEAETEVEAAATKKDPVEKRIGQLTRKWRTAERSLNNERSKRQDVETKLKKLEAQIPDTEKPVREDFESDVDYIEALTDWKVDAKFKVQQAGTAQTTEEKQRQQSIEDVEQKIEEICDRGREKYEDYDKLVFDQDLQLTQEMSEIALMSDIAEDILYHLGSNPDASATISKLPVLKAAREIGKIETELLAKIPKPNTATDGKPKPNGSEKPVVTQKKTTKAPAPISPIPAAGIIEKDPSQMSPKEYRRWRESN